MEHSEVGGQCDKIQNETNHPGDLFRSLSSSSCHECLLTLLAVELYQPKSATERLSGASATILPFAGIRNAQTRASPPRRVHGWILKHSERPGVWSRTDEQTGDGSRVFASAYQELTFSSIAQVRRRAASTCQDTCTCRLRIHGPLQRRANERLRSGAAAS
jgi:hypothetical protein